MKLIHNLTNNKFWSSVATLSLGQVIAQGINLFSIPMISRIYSKTAYGDFGLVTSTATLIIGLIGLGLGSAIMAADSDEEGEKVLRSCYFIQFILSSVLCTLLAIISPYFKLIHSSLPYLQMIIVMYIYINLSILSSLLSVYINRKGLNKVLLVNPLIGALSTLIITLPLGILGLDGVGLYVANIISLIIVNIHMLRYVRLKRAYATLAEILTVVKKYKHFVIYQYPSNLMGTFSSQFPNQLLARCFGTSALGDYSMCNKVFGMPSALIAAPIQIVYFRTLAQKFREGDDIAEFTYALVTKILLLAGIPLVIGMAFGREIFAFVLGENWATAGQIASILALQFIFSFCYSCVTYCRVVIGKQKINLAVTFVQLILIIVALSIGAFKFKTYIATIFCFAVANTFFCVFNLAMNFYCMKKRTINFVIFSTVYISCSLLCAELLKIVFIK